MKSWLTDPTPHFMPSPGLQQAATFMALNEQLMARSEQFLEKNRERKQRKARAEGAD